MKYESFGNKLEEELSKKKMTKESLSKKAGITINELNFLINGERKPRAITIGKIAEALECDLGELIKTIYD